MLWTVFVILLCFWLVGVVTANSLGGLIHILLVAAMATVVIGFMQGRRSTA